MSTPPEGMYPGAQELAKLGDLVRRWLLHLGVPAIEVDDLAQETLYSALKSVRHYDPAKGPLEGWLWRIVSRAAGEFHERAQQESTRARAVGDALVTEARANPNPEDEVMAAQRHHAVHEILPELDAARRAVLVAHYFEDQSVEEVSAALEIPPGTVKTRLRAARDDVDAELGRRGLRGALVLPFAAALVWTKEARAATGASSASRQDRWLRRILRVLGSEPAKYTALLGAGAVAGAVGLALIRPAPGPRATSSHVGMLVVAMAPAPTTGTDVPAAVPEPLSSAAPAHTKAPSLRAERQDNRRKRALLQEAMLAVEHGDMAAARRALARYDQEFPNEPAPHLRLVIDQELQKSESVSPLPPK
jgi:RNA polymerase sigma-70 factor, ECF subfamily